MQPTLMEQNKFKIKRDSIMFIAKNLRKALISSCVLVTVLQSYCAIVLQGDSTTAGQSFIQPISLYLQGADDLFYVAAHTPGAKNFSIAVVGPKEEKFTPLAEEHATVDSNTTVTNPLYDTQIDHLALMSGRNILSVNDQIINKITVVTHKEPSTVYLIDSLPSDTTKILSVRNIKDAAGQESKGIIQMVADNAAYLFAAVKGHESDTFGEGSSGIAILGYTAIKKENEAQEKTYFQQIPAHYITLDGSETIAATPLNNTSNSIRIDNSTIQICDNALHLNWTENLKCLYTALHINAQGTESDGGIAVVIGTWLNEKIETQNKNIKKDLSDDKGTNTKDEPATKEAISHSFILKRLAYDSAFQTGVNNIIGTRGSNVTISIHQTRPLFTSTVLNYLVVLGGLGTAEQTRQTVYALPVVKTPTICNGMLAKKDAIPYTYYHENSLRIIDRCFIDPAINPGDLFTADDSEVQVGHGPMTEGAIISIMTYSDAVYAVVQPQVGNKPGIFYSQALFDSLGRIKEWTTWKRAYTHATDYIFGAALSQHTGNMTFIAGPSSNTIHTVKRAVWNNNDTTLSAQLAYWENSLFPTDINGIQGIFDMPLGTPGLLDISLLITTGNKRVALAQTSVEHNGVQQPLLGDALAHNPAIFDNGTIDHELAADTNAIAITSGALDEIGIIKAATITAYSNHGYLFVGGTNGLAVLINNQGYSWDALTGLGNNLAGLTAGSYFKKIGSYSFIRKLICDETQGLLYVVSDSTFDRIDIQASNFITSDIQKTTLATRGQSPLNAYDTINDAVVSRSLCILGTSNGLYQNGPSTDIRITEGTDIHWQKIPLAEGLCTARQIFCVTYTGREQDLTSEHGGNIYVLDTNPGKNLAMVHRFTITPTQNSQNPYIIEQFPDIFIKDIPTYFVQFAGYRNWIYTNGSLFFQERDRTIHHKPLCSLLPAYVKSGLRFGGNREEIIPVSVQGADIIQPIVALSSSGSWFLAQNNILSVNE
jgi:hypothetical protein